MPSSSRDVSKIKVTWPCSLILYFLFFQKFIFLKQDEILLRNCNPVLTKVLSLNLLHASRLHKSGHEIYCIYNLCGVFLCFICSENCGVQNLFLVVCFFPLICIFLMAQALVAFHDPHGFLQSPVLLCLLFSISEGPVWGRRFCTTHVIIVMILGSVTRCFVGRKVNYIHFQGVNWLHRVLDGYPLLIINFYSYYSYLLYFGNSNSDCLLKCSNYFSFLYV